MEMDAMLFWNIILTMVVLPFGWAFNTDYQEILEWVAEGNTIAEAD